MFENKKKVKEATFDTQFDIEMVQNSFLPT